MPTQPRMSLQTVAFNPTPFQAVTFTPQSADTNILARSFDTVAQREKETSEKISALDQTFSQLRSKVHQDPETLKWFEDYTRAQKLKVRNYVDNYDFAGAINKATELAGEVINDPELNARIQSNTSRTNLENVLHKRVQEGKVNKSTERWFLNKKSPYKFIPKVENGVVVGGTMYDESELPYDDLSALDVLNAAKTILEVHKDSRSSQSSKMTGTQGGEPGETTTIIKTGGGSSTTHEWNTAQELWNNMDAIIDSIPDGRARIKQGFDAAMYEYEELENEIKYLRENNTDGRYATDIKNKEEDLKKRQNLLYHNGGEASYEQYYMKLIMENKLVPGAVRDWYTKSSSSEYYNVSDKNPTRTAGGSTLDGNQQGNNGDDGSFLGNLLPGPHGKDKSQNAAKTVEASAKRTHKAIQG